MGKVTADKKVNKPQKTQNKDQYVTIMYSGLKQVIFLCNFTVAKVSQGKIITQVREHEVDSTLPIDDVMIRLLPDIIIFIILFFLYYESKTFLVVLTLAFFTLVFRQAFMIVLTFLFPLLYTIYQIDRDNKIGCISCWLDTLSLNYEYSVASVLASYFLYVIFVFLTKKVIITKEGIVMAVFDN